MLGPDQKSCVLYRQDGQLYFSVGSEILFTPLFGQSPLQRRFNTLRAQKQGNRILGIDFNNQADRLYYVDYDGHYINDYRTLVVNQSRTECIVQGLGHPQNVAADWINGQIYFVNDVPAVIGVCSEDGRFCKTLIDQLVRPRGIALHPKKGMLFWSDWGDQPKIERSALDGSNRTVLVSDSIVWPNSLSVDYIRNHLYWIDAKLKHIERCDLDGNNRQIILNSGLEHPYDLVVFDKKIFWTDWGMKSVFAFDLITRTRETIYSSPSLYPFGIALKNTFYQDSSNFSDPCIAANCTHLCALRFEEGPQCLCPDGYHWDDLYSECFPDTGNKKAVPEFQPGLCLNNDRPDSDEMPGDILPETPMMVCENGGSPDFDGNGRLFCRCPSATFFGTYCELNWDELNDRLFSSNKWVPAVGSSYASQAALAGKWIAGILVFALFVLILIGLVLYHRRTAYYGVFSRCKQTVLAPSVLFRKRISSVSHASEERSSLTKNESVSHLHSSPGYHPTVVECGFSNPVYDEANTEDVVENKDDFAKFRVGSKGDLNSMYSDTDSALDCTTGSLSSANGSSPPRDKRY
jgi:hypothetical protein